jgi:hypothetical protein
MDERLVQRLEEQLRDAHATNAGLREQLGDVEARERAAGNKLSEAEIHMRQLEKSHATQKAAEDNAAAAQRKQREAERDAREVCAVNEELHRRLKEAYDHAAELEELNEPVKRAQGVADLIGVRT